jgi:hypothetical protein
MRSEKRGGDRKRDQRKRAGGGEGERSKRSLFETPLFTV